MLKTSGRRRARRILLATIAVGAAIAYRNAVADRGGFYDPATADPR